MSIKELYTKGTHIWLPDATNVWRNACLIDNYNGGDSLKVQLEGGKKVKVKVHSENELPHLRNPEVLIGENDLTSLSYLHEPAVLHNLQVRFCERNYIYTYCGIVLVAINPYQQMPLYDLETIHAYSGQDMASMDPHIFAIAEEAFKRMSRFDENQSIIVSGESGAGKTVSAKYAMRYFATVCGAKDESQIEKRVLATNPIMEAIGNAKTTRNDNSSRFGKFIEIGFSDGQRILGANMRTYLLEKSRVVSQAPDERNYHIFYQLCSAADDPAFKQYLLDSADEFAYTKFGCTSMVDSIRDPEDFLSFCQALSLMGINQSKQSQIFRILSGILHFGNVVIVKSEKTTEEGSMIEEKDKFIKTCSKLLGVDSQQLRYWLCNKKMVTAGEVLAVPLTPHQAISSRNALAKHIYAQLFLWIVQRLNASLASSSKTKSFIGVLDIYGFESFEVNSFEQFCINYANEKLQQQFCLHVFKLEQEEYVREEIKWSFIDFHDNQQCIGLIEDKLGVLDLLHEECKMVNGSDDNWCRKLYDRHSQHKHFSKPRLSNQAFIIHHFADDVEYEIEGFLEKNRDKVLEEHINIFKASEYELIAELFNEDGAETAAKSGVVRSSAVNSKKSSTVTRQHGKTVGSQFSESLSQLMKTLFSTTPHYVRCIKPNDLKMPLTFDPVRSVQQLRACGVLETVRISAAGYPGRWTYQDFYKRYRVLAHSKWLVKQNLLKTCNNIISNIISDTDKFQCGKTKIFFRAGQVAYLEKLRFEKLMACSIRMQKIVKGWLCRKRYSKIKKMVVAVQKMGRGILARRRAEVLRRSKACTCIGAAWKGYKGRCKYTSIRKSVVCLQTMARSLMARKRYVELTSLARILTIQRYIRGWLIKKKCRRVMNGVVKMQGVVRKMIAKKRLKKLKAETKTTEHINTKGIGLENKIIELQQRLDEKAKQVTELKEEKEVNVDLKNEINCLKKASKSATVAVGHASDLQERIKELTEELEIEINEKEKIKTEKEMIRIEKDDIINNLNAEREMLKVQIESVSQEIKAHVENQEDVTKRKIEEATILLNHDIEMERSNHQRLIKEHNRLQQRLDNYHADSNFMRTPSLKRHHRSLSNVSEFSLESESSGGDKNDLDSGIGGNKKGLIAEETDLASIAEKTSKLSKRDVSLVIKLQSKLKEIEVKNRKLKDDINRKEFPYQDAIFGLKEIPFINVFEAFKIQEMEIENASIRNQLSRLQKVLTESASNYDVRGGKTKQLYDQFEAVKEELKHKHNEVARLKTLLFKSQQQLQQCNNNNGNNNAYVSNNNVGSSNTHNSEDIVLNEDGELSMAFDSQKKLNQLLEAELQRNVEISMMRDQDLLSQIENLRKTKEQQDKLLFENIELSSEAKVESALVNEVARITDENLNLYSQLNSSQDSLHKLRRAVKIYSKRLKSSDVSDANMELERELAQDEGMPIVKYQPQREWSGMLEFKKEDLELLMKNLILDLRAEVMLKEPAHLPSFLLFMCVRHIDFIKDDEKVEYLLNTALLSIRKAVQKHPTDQSRIIAWLANSVRLLNLFKQYSGDKIFQSSNTLKQNEHCLKNFDLSEYMNILNNLVISTYQMVVKLIQGKIQNLIVGAILEKEMVTGCTTGKPTNHRQVSIAVDDIDLPQQSSPDDLIKIFDQVIQHLCAHNVDSDVISQIFRQVFYFICATSLNTLLLRKDLCRWTKAVQIRYNISQLEQWVRDNKLQDGGVMHCMEPLVQATQLLLARKSEEDVDSICDAAAELTMTQIVKLLNLYTPVDEFEVKVPISLIRKVKEKLNLQQLQLQQQQIKKKQNEQEDNPNQDSLNDDREQPPQQPPQQPLEQQPLMMDLKHEYTIHLNFKPSKIALEELKVPTAWGLGFLKKI